MPIESAKPMVAGSSEDSLLGGCFDWLKRNALLFIGIGICLQLAVIAMIALDARTILVRGETLLLRVTPIDPRDLLRGEYVILTYDINHPQDFSNSSMSYGFEAGTTVYVMLVPEKDGKHWRPNGYSFERPSSGKFIRGKSMGYNWIEFGIESYFLQEGEGAKYEKAITEGTVSAEIALASDGRAILKRLLFEPDAK